MGDLCILDVVSCGFGAIILLLVLTKIGEPRALEAIRTELEGLVAKLEQELFEIRGETNVLERDLKTKVEQLSTEREAINGTPTLAEQSLEILRG